MICPYCGAANTDESIFCSSCGFDMTVPTSETDSTAVTSEDSSAIHRRPNRRVKKKCTLLNPRMLFAIAGLVVVVLGICLLVSCIKHNTGYVAYEHNIYVGIYDEQVHILQDAKKAKPTDLKAKSIQYHQASMDGSIVAILTDTDVLAVIRNGKLTPVAENVDNFVLSVDGTGLAYVTENAHDDYATLKLYNVVTKKTKTVTYQHTQITYDLAPDGDSLAYYAKQEGKESSDLIFFDGKKNIPITDSNISLLGLSNDGKYIYTVARNEDGDRTLYCYNKSGNRTLIGPCNIKLAYFNADHTQILYYNSVSTADTDTYESSIASKGNKGNLILSGASVASALIPPNCTTFTTAMTVTAPIDDFYGKVFTCWGENGMDVWMLKENTEKNVKLVSDVNYIRISQDGKRVYYKVDDTLKVLKVSNGTRASEKAVTLGEDVVNFKFTSDGKKVYYQTKTDLYCVNGKNGNGQKKIAENVELGLFMNAEGVVYYMIKNDVYASKNAGKSTLVLSNAESISTSVKTISSLTDTVVYIIMNDDSIYASDGKLQPKLIWSED